jgi:two-component system, cell cycle sensor histidine kinase and response regulator CckA
MPASREERLRVLVVGDRDEDARDVIGRLEAGGYRVVTQRVANPSTLAAALLDGPWDVIISDWRLDGFSGAAALAAVRGMNLDIPFIIVSGVVDEETAVTAMRAGAQDFVGRGNLARLLPAVEREVRDARIRHEHGRVEAALADTAQRLRFTLQQVPVIFWTTDRALRFTSSLGSGLHAVGLEPDAVVGRTIAEVIEPLDPAITEAHTAALSGATSGFDCTWLGRDYRALVSPYRAPDGEIVGAIGIALDITEQKQLQEAVRARERRFRSLIEKSRDVISILDRGARVLYHSPAITRLTGYAPDELVGRSAFYLIHEADQAAVESAWQNVLGPGAGSVRFRVRHRDGGWREAEATATNLLDDPAVRGVVVNTRDVTDRVAAERQVRFQAQLLDAVDQAIIATDLDGRVLYWNRCAEELYGWPPEEAVGRDVDELTVPRRSAGEADTIWARLRAGEAWSGEMVVRRRDGTEFHAAIADAPIFNDQGEIIGVVGSSSDLTERRRLEAQLRNAQKMEAVGRLAGGIAHDFNNLLTAIRGYADFLLDDLPEGPSRDDVAEIHRVTERAVALTRQLLVFGKRQVAQPQLLDVNAVVDELHDMLARVLGEDIDLACSLAPELPAVRMDRAQLEQVLLNLVFNARDAMPDGGRLAIETRLAQSDGAVEIVVTDSGSGIPPAVLPHIFEPFFTTKGAGGTGLGLSTVYAIAEQAGGEVRARSCEGEGATLTVRLPAAETRTRQDPVHGPAVIDHRGTGTVLVVEDEAHVRAVVRRVLEQRGYTVVEASDGHEALRRWEALAGSVQLVLTDVVLPGLSGPEVAERIRRESPDVPVLFMSGYTDDMAALKRVSGRDVPLIEKPFTPQSLLARVVELVAAGGAP